MSESDSVATGTSEVDWNGQRGEHDLSVDLSASQKTAGAVTQAAGKRETSAVKGVHVSQHEVHTRVANKCDDHGLGRDVGMVRANGSDEQTASNAKPPSQAAPGARVASTIEKQADVSMIEGVNQHLARDAATGEGEHGGNSTGAKRTCSTALEKPCRECWGFHSNNTCPKSQSQESPDTASPKPGQSKQSGADGGAQVREDGGAVVKARRLADVPSPSCAAEVVSCTKADEGSCKDKVSLAEKDGGAYEDADQVFLKEVLRCSD